MRSGKIFEQAIFCIIFFCKIAYKINITTRKEERVMRKFLKAGICLLFCMSTFIITAFGTDQSGISSYTVSSEELISNSAYVILDNANAEYNAYRILDLQLEQICDHTSTESHTQDCYNYLYSANEKYIEAFYQFAPDMDSDGLFTDTDVVYYISAVWDDDELSNNMAGLLYEQIKTMDLLPDTVIGGTLTSALDQGYYLLVNADNEATEDFDLLDTMGYSTISLTETIPAPKVENYVQANSNDQNEGDMELLTDDYNGYLGSATYHTGDTISFRAKYYIDEIEQYPCTIGVELSGGLFFFNSKQIAIQGISRYQLNSNNNFSITLNDLSEAQHLAGNGVIELAYNVRLSADSPYRSVSTAYVEYGNTRKTSVASVYTYSVKVHCEENIQFELVNTENDSLMNFDLEEDAYIFTGVASGKYQLIVYNSGEQIDSMNFSISSLTHKSCIDSMGVSNDAFSTDEIGGIMEIVYSEGEWTTVETIQKTEENRAQSLKTSIIVVSVAIGIFILVICYVLYSEKKLQKSKK